MKPTMLDKARLLPLTAAAGLALAMAAAGCTGLVPNSTASAPTSAVTPAATAAATGTPTPASTSTEPPAAAPKSITPAPRTPPGPGRCHTADLAARLRELDPAAGSRHAALVLTNRSTSTCGVYGYGGVQLLDATRHPLPTHQIRGRRTPPRLVLLRPGRSVSSLLHWSAVPAGTEPCQPNPAYLLVTPPDETQPITLAWSASEVCSHGRIVQGAYAAGTPID